MSDAAALSRADGLSGRDYPCERCGAPTAFSPAHQTLACGHCFYVAAPLAGAPALGRFPVDACRAPKLAEGQAIESWACDGCGALVVRHQDHLSARCTFCASTSLAPRLATSGIVAPHGLVPMRIDAAEAEARVKQWLKSLYFRPSDLAAGAVRTGIRGVYVPLWFFDADTDAEWSGQRGDEYTETREENGQRVSETKVRWTSVSGERSDTFQGQGVNKAAGLDTVFLSELELTLEGARAYQSDFLIGWDVAAPSLDVDQAWTQAQASIDAEVRRRCERDIGGDRQRLRHVHTQFHLQGTRLVLMPLWVYAYKYRHDSFQVLVDGNKGIVSGGAPYSLWKICVAVVSALMLIALFLYWQHQR